MPLYLNGSYTYTPSDDPTPTIVTLVGIHESLVVVRTNDANPMDEHVVTRRDFEEHAELRRIWGDRCCVAGFRSSAGRLMVSGVYESSGIAGRPWAIDLSLVPEEAYVFGYDVCNTD